MLGIIKEGIAAGAAYGLWKYYNKKQKAIAEGREEKLTFEKKKFVKTLLIGALVGGVAAYSGISVEFAFGNELLYFGAVVAVEEVIKTGARLPEVVSRFLKKQGIL